MRLHLYAVSDKRANVLLETNIQHTRRPSRAAIPMSTLKKNKRLKLAKKFKKYGENKPSMGNSVCQRGKAKYLGGNGRKTTGITRRKFKLNLQKIRVVEDGQVVRRAVPVSLIRSGMIEKPVVRKPFTVEAK